ncbi:MAG: serine/threonine protein kinase [Planctomycetes bacterium]|nr:serine/threonine protein kinase [Planctomycetota bacterium]MCB9870718.1 serine/threonine protein kinase [Planctomycetota bacterium]MCB9889053.1 serine/threonine protein kinase [Planctomycetota bacterium]
MSLRDVVTPETPDGEGGPASAADLRMAEILRRDTQTVRARDELQQEASEEADDLLGRLNALEFIDDVLGEECQLPSRIGEFEIQGVLGRGGMGTVYRAYQKTLDREVALKVLAPRFSSDVTMRKRFRKEAKASAAMHHQHIVPIYDYGEAGGNVFFAMERVHGVSLDKYISAARRNGGGALDPRDAARRFAGVADALAFAHKRQILHRDVKPGNVLVHPDGTLALADFGLSKFLDDEPSAHLTSVGGFLGTLHYAPPEQARGEKLGPASDLYSLGVTMFETLVGNLPIRGDTTEAMLHALLHEEPQRLRQALPKAPRDLDVVIEKLLQKDPRHRYQDGEALALDLLRVAEDEPVRIRRQSALGRLYRRAKRNPVVTASLGTLLVLLLVVALWVKSLSDNKALKGRESLSNASVVLAREQGRVLGPHSILNALLGMPLQETAPDSQFLHELDQAERRLADRSDELEKYRASYRGDVLTGPDAVATALLAGQGRKVVDVATARIDAMFDAGDTHGLAARIDLYNLYLARAMAYLSASVADPEAADRDLYLASFMRGRAFLPRLLRALLQGAKSNPNQLLQTLQKLAEDALQRRVAGQLLLAFAGLCPPADCHLMHFSLEYSVRRQLTQRALEWLGNDAVRGEPDAPVGLERRLANLAATVLDDSGNAPVVAASFAAAREVLAKWVLPGSPLRGWAFAFHLLGDEAMSLDGVDDEARVYGAAGLVRVVQLRMGIDRGETYLRGMHDKLGAVARASKSVAAVALQASLQAWVGSFADAEPAVRAWLRVEPANPHASACMFCCLVRHGVRSESDLFQLATHAQEAQRNAVDPNAIARLMLQRLDTRQRIVGQKAPESPLLQRMRRLLEGSGG